MKGRIGSVRFKFCTIFKGKIMKPTHVVESKIWTNKKTGKTASLYGAVPYTPETVNDWEIFLRGFTLAFDNGTVGYGQPPMKTRKEAENKLEEWLNRIHSVIPQ